MTECDYDVIHCDVCGGAYDAPHQPPEPDWRAAKAERLLLEMVNDYHQTGLIRDHVDPNAKGWDVNPDWRVCDDMLCRETRELFP